MMMELRLLLRLLRISMKGKISVRVWGLTNRSVYEPENGLAIASSTRTARIV